MWHTILAILIFLGAGVGFSAALLLLMHFGPSFNQSNLMGRRAKVMFKRPPTT
jgi:hypothetical protein